MHEEGENPSDSEKYRYFLKLWETNTTLRQPTMLMENTEDQLKGFSWQKQRIRLLKTFASGRFFSLADCRVRVYRSGKTI